ncbi:membrane protein [Bacillus manliponensis]|uniref:Probable membrane transporter protein n=1 Tax=Bacillus manliponensis TaxID=574376 RepID=A0A073JRX8_9BACI|nr:sulfite exporter TauE/SafE family protein [Bacillus manliponensis]KEK17080.1 membrane protein [Bacillus manliponensis]
MQKLIIFAIIGFFAQLIDGALGMAYGVTSSSLLLMFGIAPAVASASVHLSEVVTTAASGVSHIRFGNVDKYTVSRLTLPGAIGAFIGACFLSNLPGDIVKPYISIFLFSLGVYILLRFILQKQIVRTTKRMSSKQLVPLGLFAGFIDSTGGGGWGPITTPVLLAKGNEARKVVGSVDTSEFPVALAASIGFLISLGWEQISWFWVLALMLGGIVAAPIAAWLVRTIPSHLLGVFVGGIIILTNLRTLLLTFSVEQDVLTLSYVAVILIVIIALIFSIRNHAQHTKQNVAYNDQKQVSP